VRSRPWLRLRKINEGKARRVRRSGGRGRGVLRWALLKIIKRLNKALSVRRLEVGK
jgi:hypothetical protein